MLLPFAAEKMLGKGSFNLPLKNCRGKECRGYGTLDWNQEPTYLITLLRLCWES